MKTSLLVLAAILEVGGLTASPSAVDGDWTRRLVRTFVDGAVVKLTNGVYRLDEAGAHRMFLAPSNNSSGEKSVVFPLVGLSDVVFDGGGSTLVFAGRTFPFAALGCTNVTLRNFTVTTLNPSCAGFVTEAKDDRGFTIRMDDGVCPYRVADGELVFDLNGYPVATRDGRLSLHALDRICIHYLMTPQAKGDKDEFPAPFVGASAVDLGDHRIRFTYSGDKHPKSVRLPYAVGEKVVINLEERRYRDVFFFQDCEGVRLENVRIRRFGGMGMVAQRSGNLTVAGLVAEPEAGERVTLTADIFQFINCHGQIALANCRVGDSLDDAINVHGNYLRVEKVARRRVWLKIGHEGQMGFLPCRMGDRLEFIVERTRRVAGAARVVAIESAAGNIDGCVLEIDADIAGIAPGMLVENATLNPDVTITGCRFRNYPNIRLSGRGRYRIEGNEFVNAYTALRLWDLAEYWYESGRLSSVEVLDNVFRDCTHLGGEACINTGVSGWGADAPKIHGAILIRNNRFEGHCAKKFSISGFRTVDIVEPLAGLPDRCSYVDVFTGTSGTGHTHPAAACPFGMVQAGPDTGTGEWAYCPGYQYRDRSVLGYSLTHLSGTGCPDYNDVQILPFSEGAAAKELAAPPMKRPIDKSSEKGGPGYYRVVQDEDGVEVEITATKRAALYRLTWQKGRQAKVLLNLNFGQYCSRTWNGRATADGNSKLAGSYWRNGWISDRRLAYAFEFDHPWTKLEPLPKKAADESPRYIASFDLKPGAPLLVKVGISMTGEEGAEKNLAAEIPDWDFDGVCRAARQQWENLFARSVCEGTHEQKQNWYTALYHLYLQPNDYADVDGRFSGADNKLYISADGTYMTTLSLWDTFRAAQPWYTITTPEIVEPVVRSMLSHYETYGRLPVMSYGGHNVDCMVGNHSIPVIADAYLKGFRNFDADLAFEAITNTLTVAHPGKPKENWDLWDKYGYFPCDIIRGESVSRGFECAYDDWCAAQLAKALGKDEDCAFFSKRAENWKNTFDSSIGFGRGKTSQGKWREPFDPYAFGHGAENDNDFTEGNAFQYSWHVLQDVPGLVAAMGGRKKFVERLDALFAIRPHAPDNRGDTILLDISGMIGQYVHGNEPSHHVIYFYPQVGHPEKAAERVREVFDTQYHPGPEGLCGNDDCGQMSAWYLFSAMGFYPFNPCGGEYVIGAPQLPKVVLRVPASGRACLDAAAAAVSSKPPYQTFTILAKNLSEKNKYVKSVMLNGKPITDWKLRHEDILKGGELVFEMTDRPTLTRRDAVSAFRMASSADCLSERNSPRSVR